MPATGKATDDQQETMVNCSFCQKSRKEVAKLIAGPGVFICDECVGLCVEILQIESNKATETPAVPNWEERLSDDDLLAALPKVAALSAQVDHQLAHSVAHARSRGVTWTRIGAALGMTRQSAWERFSGEE
jgi:ATP-dependent Clp protease ATP-binding subunit ClpX